MKSIKTILAKTAICLFMAANLTTVFTSCSNDDDNSGVTLPDLTGELTLNIPENQIGAGQTFTVSFNLPPMPAGVISRTCSMSFNSYSEETMDKGTLVDNVYSKRMYIETPGTYTLRLEVANMVSTPYPDGSTESLQYLEKKITVVDTDIYYSFWGETMERTKINNGNMTLTNETPNELLQYEYTSSFSDASFLGGELKDETASLIFQYISNGLNSVAESSPCNVTRPGKFIASVYIYMENMGAKATEEKPMWIVENPQCGELFDQWIKSRDKSLITQLDELLKAETEPAVGFGFTQKNMPIGLTIDFSSATDCDLNITYGKPYN